MAQLVDQHGIPLSSAGRANVVPFHRDGLANIVSGFGTSIDRASHDFWHFMPMQPEQILAGYRSNWIISKIVDIPAEDMVREWRDWQADEAQIEALEAAEIKHGLIAKVQLGLAYGRLGGGVLLLGLGDIDPSRPMPEKIGKDALKYVHVFNRWEVSIGPEDRDITSPWFGQPSYFALRSDAAEVKIHPSRMVVFKGQTVPNMPGAMWEDVFWGDSVVQRIDRAVKNAVRAHDGFSRLIDEAKIDVYRLAGFMEQLATNEAAVRQRVEYTDAGKSSLRGVYLDKEDEFTQRQLSLTGMPEMIEALFSVIAGAADIPATRLLGRAPQGMNATGEGDDKNYQTMIRSRQRLNLSPAIDQIDAVMIPSALGGRPPEIGYSWAPLSVPTEKEQAETNKLKAETIAIYIDNALVPTSVMEESVKSMLSDDQWLPGIDKAYAEYEASNTEADPNYDPSAIVETQSKGGDRLSPTARGQNGSAGSAPAATSDAKPISLYVQRKLLNADEVIAWAKDQGFISTLPAADMHVTVLFSRTPVDPIKMGNGWEGDENGNLSIKPGGPRAVEMLGESAAVLLFASSELVWRHQRMVEEGASHDYPEYQPHVTLSYDVPEGMDLDTIQPYRGKLMFGPEIFEPLDLDWKEKVQEE